jgi:hypothetical protein
MDLCTDSVFEDGQTAQNDGVDLRQTGRYTVHE